MGRLQSVTQLDFYTFFRKLLKQISFLYFPDRGCDPAWYPISRLYTALRKRHLYPSVPDVFPLLQFHPL